MSGGDPSRAPGAKKLLVTHGYQPEFGARPLRRTIDSLHCTVRSAAAEGASPYPDQASSGNAS
ncbi:hypothetical protein OG844_41960 [Streptomyces sp. NBC_00887]|nr:hypothetical protein OG844_03640 [Streptomyces sp. NBC_00887]WSY35808.1 hypothetical protein OG844_41960 [Streptomyces sp. NBC_00887]